MVLTKNELNQRLDQPMFKHKELNRYKKALKGQKMTGFLKPIQKAKTLSEVVFELGNQAYSYIFYPQCHKDGLQVEPFHQLCSSLNLSLNKTLIEPADITTKEIQNIFELGKVENFILVSKGELIPSLAKKCKEFRLTQRMGIYADCIQKLNSEGLWQGRRFIKLLNDGSFSIS